MEERVINYLVKRGHNKETVKIYMLNWIKDKSFEFAVNQYKTPAKIADCLMCL